MFVERDIVTFCNVHAVSSIYDEAKFDGFHQVYDFPFSCLIQTSVELRGGNELFVEPEIRSQAA